MRLFPDKIAASTLDYNAPAADTAAVVTKDAATLDVHVLGWVGYSYSATPTGGALTVSIGGSTKLEIDITGAGPGELDFRDAPMYGAKNEALVVTLAAGGGTVVGKLATSTR